MVFEARIDAMELLARVKGEVPFNQESPLNESVRHTSSVFSYSRNNPKKEGI